MQQQPSAGPPRQQPPQQPWPRSQHGPGTAHENRRRRHENRLGVVLAHTSRYAFEPQARLAKDVGVSRSTISRLMSGQSRPSFELVQRITAALERALKRSLDPRELFSPDGTYPTRSGCALCGCRGCLPEEAYDRWGRLRPAFQNQKPGDWTLAPATPQQPENPSPLSVNDAQ